MPYRLVATARFLSQAEQLPRDVYHQLQKQIRFLEQDPRPPSLRAHIVKNAIGDCGGKVFEAYVNRQYRLTWEYGKEPSDLILRNIDNHDERLKKP